MNARATHHGHWMSWAAALLSLFVVAVAQAYNKSWDQGHNVCVVEPGTSNWGKFDASGVFHGGFSSKECCQILCKVCPVYANTGQVQESFTDASLPGVGPALTITRTYNSQDWATSFLGNGWSFNFGKRLIIARRGDGEKIIGLILETGEKNYYKENVDGTLERLTGYGSTFDLTRNTNGSYTIRELDGTRTELKADGKIDRIIDGNNNALTFQYNAIGCVSRITNASGNYIDFQLGPNGKIAGATDNFGRTIGYGYDGVGNLVSVTDPLGNTVQYTYNSDNLLSQRTNARGSVVETITYDTNQPPRVASFVEKGETFTISYFADRTEKTDSQGNKWTYYFNDVGVIERTVDPLGNETKQSLNKITATSVDWEDDANGHRTVYTYDAHGNVLTETDPLNNVTRYSYVTGTNWPQTVTNSAGIVTRYTYDANGNVIKLARDDGGPNEDVTQFTYDSAGNLASETDAAGNVTTYHYDAGGNLTTVTDPVGNKTSYTYDRYGYKATETNPAGHAMAFQRDALGRLTQMVDFLGSTKSFEYDADGNRIKTIDFNGNSSTYEHDAWNRTTRSVNAIGGTFERSYLNSIVERITDECGKVTYNHFDLYGRIIKAVQKLGDTAQAEDGDDLVWLYTYDGVGNRLTETDPAGAVTQYRYDANNRLAAVTNPAGETISYAYDANGNQIQASYPSGLGVQYTYDHLGRRLQESDNLGTRTQYSYNAAGQTATITNGNGHTTSYVYDAVGNVLTETDPAGNITRYSYDAVGNLVAVVDREGHSTMYAYDANNRVVLFTDALGAVKEYAFDANGNQISAKDDNGRITAFEFDKLNRPTRRNYPDGTFDLQNYDCFGNLKSVQGRDGAVTTYDYDDLYRNTGVDLPGSDDPSFSYDVWNRIRTAQNSQSSIAFRYDLAGRLTEAQQDGHVLGYVHDPAANTRTITYPGGRVVGERYDQRDRLVALADGAGKDLVTYSYDGANRLLTGQVGSLFQRRHQYDANGSLTRLVYEQGGSAILDFDYGYDREGHRLYAEAKHANSQSEQYGYDPAYRLISFKRGILDNSHNIAAPSLAMQFTYDGAENRLSKSVNGVSTNYTPDAANAYTDIGGVSQHYDANGNLVDDGTLLYSYGPRNELLSVTEKSSGIRLVDYRYDALGRRVARVKGRTTTALIYDGQGLSVLGEIPDSGDAVQYLRGAGLTEIVQLSRGGVDYLLRSDGAGSVLQVADDTGNIIETYRYDPFGGVSRFNVAGNPITDSQIGNRVAFIGQALEPDSGLYEFHWRAYRPGDGRFQTVDPLGYTDSLNLFAYAKNDPINSFDPTGLIATTVNITAPIEYKSYPDALGVSRYDLATADKTQIALEGKPTGKECCEDGTIVNKGFAKEMKYTIKHLTLDITIPTWVDRAELERSLFKWKVWWVLCDKTQRRADGYFRKANQIFKPAGANWRRLTTAMVETHELVHSVPQAKKHVGAYFNNINSPEKTWCPDNDAKAQKGIAAWQEALEKQYGTNAVIQGALLSNTTGYYADTVKYESEADDAGCGF